MFVMGATLRLASRHCVDGGEHLDAKNTMPLRAQRSAIELDDCEAIEHAPIA